MFQPDRLADLIQEGRCAGPAPYTLEHLAEWLAKQPRYREYDYMDTCGCLLHQYASSCGVKYIVEIYSETLGPQNEREAVEACAAEEPYTFGAALTRAQAALERFP